MAAVERYGPQTCQLAIVTLPLGSGPNTLLGTGLGLLWQQGDRLSMRFDLGMPLVPLAEARNGLQESGIYYSVRYMLF